MLDKVLHYITIITTVLFVAYVIIFFMRIATTRGIGTAFSSLFTLPVLGPLLAVLIIGTLSSALVFIEPPEVGVVISLASEQGVRDRPFSSGLHWIVPLVERVELYPISWQTYTMSGKPDEGEELGDDSIRARTSDGQEVLLDCSVIFRVDAQQAVRVHIDWQQRYIKDFIRPLMRGFVRTQVSQFKVDEVNSSARRDLEATLDRMLREEFGDKGLVLDQFLLRDITFSPEYAASIEQKQVALEKEQEKIHEAEQIRQLARGKADAYEIEAQGKAKAVVIEAEARSKALATEAEGQAKAFRLVGEALDLNQDVLTYEYIHKISPNIRVMLLPNDAPLILSVPDLEGESSVTDTIEVSPTLSTTQPISNTLPIPRR